MSTSQAVVPNSTLAGLKKLLYISLYPGSLVSVLQTPPVFFIMITAKTGIFPNCRNIIMDIGDVLVTMSLDTTTTIPANTFRTILTSPTWGRYECGKLTEPECYRMVAEEHNLDVDEFTCGFNQDIRGSITLNQPLFAYLRQLKSELGPALRLYVMSNISQPDIELLLAKHPDEWAIFEEIFPSSKVGTRKPRLGFYRHALDSIGANPKDVVFVDDKAENVLTAKSFGMHGVVFKQLEEFRRVMRCLVCNPISRGADYLHAHICELDVGKLGAVALANGITSTQALGSLKTR